MSSQFNSGGVPTEAEIAARLNAENGLLNPDIQFIESSGMKVEFRKQVVIIHKDGELEKYIGMATCLSIAILGVFFIKIDVWLFTIFGWLFLALVPFGLYEQLMTSGSRSYQLIIFRELQSIVRKNRSQGFQRCKTGYFLDIQVLYRFLPTERSSRYYFTQLTCEQGVIWLGGGMSERSENKFATALAEWLGVDLKPTREISVFENPINPLLPFDQPWK